MRKDLSLERRKNRKGGGWLALCACVLLLAAARPARAEDAAAIDRMSKEALEAYDSLNFDQAKSLLEKAIAAGEASGLERDPSMARAHLDLGMVMFGGFQQREDALEHFKTAVGIQANVRPPSGLFNPEMQAIFDEAKRTAREEKDAQVEALAPKRQPRAARPPTAVKKAKPKEAEESASDGDGTGFYLGLGFGSGGGIARGQLDTNKDLFQGQVQDSTWSGGFATSRLGHLTADVGYFLSSDMLLSLEGRIQFVSGTSPVMGSMSCPTTCSAPSTGIAALAKLTYYFSSGDVRPFVVGGLGGGAIRQVVKLNVTPDMITGATHCGSDGKQECVDTVTGGPFLIAVGGGLAYQLGSVALLGSLVSNVGIPHFMLNFDLTLGIGLHL